jgi:hypothetical protein
MNKTLQTLRYLSRGFTWLTGICFLSLLGNVAVTDVVFDLTDRYNSVHPPVTLTAPLEITAGIFALIIGLVLFLINFKVTLANGITRKTYLLANLPAAGIVAAVLAVINLSIVGVHGLFRPVILSISLVYPQAGWAGLLVWQFALYFLLIVAGWLISLTYYRSNTLLKWIVSLAPVILFSLLKIANALSAGAVFHAIAEYQRISMATAGRAALTMLAYAILFCGIVYLLIRRAPLKN